MDIADLTLVQFVAYSLGGGVVLRVAAEGVQSVGALIYTLLKGL